MNQEQALSKLHIWEKELISPNKDPKDPSVLRNVRIFADRILSLGFSANELGTLEKVASSGDIRQSFSNQTHLAIKIAKSKAIISGCDIHISIVMPAYGENIRMMPRGTKEGHHPNGENFIVEKSNQLNWLFSDTTSTYKVYIVDDMSKPEPVSSGTAAIKVIEDNKIDNFKVIFLEQGVKDKANDSELSVVLKNVEYPKNTKEAGAVYYGFYSAIKDHGSDDSHVIILTDCDLSVDLGQIGNLVEPIIYSGKVSGAGSRRLPESILEIVGNRNLRANTARYFRQLLLPGLLPKDTQCGAKAFSSSAVKKLLRSDRQVLDFAFDIELLTLIALQNGPERIAPVPVAWFDSAEMTTTDSSVHLKIMKAQLDIARANKTGSGDNFNKLIEISEILTKDEETWLAFLEALENRSDLTLAMERFDTKILPDLEHIAKSVSVSKVA